jgi:hypothetical protein
MDEKIDKLLGECPGYPLDLSDAEQQVWLNAQRAMLEVGYRKPQQPAGELVENPYKCFCVTRTLYKLVRRMSDAEADEDYASHKFDAGRQAQLAHDKATMAKLPSEDECIEICRDLIQNSTNIRQAGENLFRLLGGKP